MTSGFRTVRASQRMCGGGNEGLGGEGVPGGGVDDDGGSDGGNVSRSIGEDR